MLDLRALFWTLLVLPLSAGGTPAEVVFDVPAPLATRAAVASRLFHGYQWQRVAALAADKGVDLEVSPIDPAMERWEVYAPPACAAGARCGVLVWIHPWEDASLPRDWPRVLDALQLVYVSARRSGNTQDVLDRRVPLALTGLAGVQARYAIDPERTYVGGFSGGGRVASRIAAGYAEHFAGGLFVGTADGIGRSEVPVPAEPGLSALLGRGRYVFLAGGQDPANLDYSRSAVRAFRENCVTEAHLMVVADWYHRTADARWLRRALERLEAGPRSDADATATCRAAREAAGRAALAAATDEGAALEAHRRFGGFISAEFQAWLARNGSAAPRP
jgi:dienelactone hydrolase